MKPSPIFRFILNAIAIIVSILIGIIGYGYVFLKSPGKLENNQNEKV